MVALSAVCLSTRHVPTDGCTGALKNEFHEEFANLAHRTKNVDTVAVMDDLNEAGKRSSTT